MDYPTKNVVKTLVSCSQTGFSAYLLFAVRKLSDSHADILGSNALNHWEKWFGHARLSKNLSSNNLRSRPKIKASMFKVKPRLRATIVWRSATNHPSINLYFMTYETSCYK